MICPKRVWGRFWDKIEYDSFCFMLCKGNYCLYPGKYDIFFNVLVLFQEKDQKGTKEGHNQGGLLF